MNPADRNPIAQFGQARDFAVTLGSQFSPVRNLLQNGLARKSNHEDLEDREEPESDFFEVFEAFAVCILRVDSHF